MAHRTLSYMRRPRRPRPHPDGGECRHRTAPGPGSCGEGQASLPSHRHMQPAPLPVMEVPPPSLPTDATRRAGSTSPRWREPCTARPGAQRGPTIWPLLRPLFWARKTGRTPGRKRGSPTVGLHLFRRCFWPRFLGPNLGPPCGASAGLQRQTSPASIFMHSWPRFGPRPEDSKTSPENGPKKDDRKRGPERLVQAIAGLTG